MTISRDRAALRLMSMCYEAPDLSHVAEDLNDVPAPGWGAKELAREIELLEAVVRRDRFDALVDAAVEDNWVSGDGVSRSISKLVINRRTGQQGCLRIIRRGVYEEYARDAILAPALSVLAELDFVRASARRLRRAYGGNLSLALIHKLGIATGLLRLISELRLVSSKLLKLKTIAIAACLRMPLFSYGPELSWFRHRLRLTLA